MMQRGNALRPPSLTAVIHAVVKDAPSGLTAETIAALLGQNYATMMSELSRQPRHKFDADLVLPAMNLADSDEPAHFLARQRGGVFVKLPRCSGPADAVQLAAMRSVKEFGELMAEIGDDLADDVIDRAECERIEKEGHEAVTAIVALLEKVAAIRRSLS